MTYLVDVNVICEPTKQNPNPKVLEWLIANRRELVVDPIIMGEI
jgi:predicted nucleic acid-binding protein